MTLLHFAAHPKLFEQLLGRSISTHLSNRHRPATCLSDQNFSLQQKSGFHTRADTLLQQIRGHCASLSILSQNLYCQHRFQSCQKPLVDILLSALQPLLNRSRHYPLSLDISQPRHSSLSLPKKETIEVPCLLPGPQFWSHHSVTS